MRPHRLYISCSVFYAVCIRASALNQVLVFVNWLNHLVISIMADSAPAKTAMKKASKPKQPAAHPTYNLMIAEAVGALKERGGSSRQAILKYIVKSFNVGSNETIVNSHVKLALKANVKKGSLKQSKGRDLGKIIILF